MATKVDNELELTGRVFPCDGLRLRGKKRIEKKKARNDQEPLRHGSCHEVPQSSYAAEGPDSMDPYGSIKRTHASNESDTAGLLQLPVVSQGIAKSGGIGWFVVLTLIHELRAALVVTKDLIVEV